MDSPEVREKIREALENGVRRMNLNQEAARLKQNKVDLAATMDKLDQLQHDIQQSFDSARQEFESQERETSPTKSWPGTEGSVRHPESPVRVKLLLRMKRSPVLDEVFSDWDGENSGSSGSTAEYEVLRVEGIESENEIHVDPEISFNKDVLKKVKRSKNKRKCDSPLSVTDSPTKIKKLKLILGSETVSTVNYSD